MRRLAGALSATVLALSLGVVRAGDPIQFSGDKAKPAPGAQAKPVDSDAFKSWNKSRSPTGGQLNTLTPFITHGDPLDPKEQRRLKNVRDEKRNWMLLEPGELQKREENEDGQFGGKGVAIDDFEDDETDNFLFYNVAQENKPRSAPMRSNPSEPADQPKKDHRSMSIFGPRETDKVSAHQAGELNLRGLIDTSQSGAPHLNKNEASLAQFLKDNAPAAADRDQQARRDTFRNFINGGPANNATPGGLADPINFRTDLTQERMNPIMPHRHAFELPTAPKAPDSFLSKPPAGLVPGRAPGLPEMVTSAPRQPLGGASLPSPLLIQNEPKNPRAGVMGSGSLFNREVQRRGGL